MKKKILFVLALTLIFTLGGAMTVFAKTTKKSVTLANVSKGVKVTTDEFTLTLPKSAWNKNNFTVKRTIPKAKGRVNYAFYNKANKKYGGRVFTITVTTKNEWLGDNQKVLAKVGNKYYIFYGPTDVQFGNTKKFRNSYNAMEKTLASVRNSVTIKNVYISKILRCKVSMPAPLAKKVKVSKVVNYTDKKTKLKYQEIHFVGTINKTKLDMFKICRVNKKLTAKQFEKVNPLAHYIKTSGKYTYFLQVTEQYPKKEMKAFAKLINGYVNTKCIKVAVY